MSRSERFGKPGARPVVAPGPIYDDLKRRDFTSNSLALSLNRASRGLLIDPNNGLGDLELKQLRTVSNYAFYDDPSRILRLFRFQARFGMTLDERTANHLTNSLEAGMPALIPGETKHRELLAISRESNVAEIFRLLEERGLASLFAPSLTGAKVNGAGLGKLEKAKALIPFGVELHTDHLAIFLSTLTEKFSPKDKAALIKTSELTKQEADNWQKLEGKAKKLEKELMGPKLQRASKLYYALIAAPGDQILYLLLHSTQRIVQDRIKNFLQKHVLVAQEVTEADVEAAGFVRGTVKFAKAKIDLTSKHLDARPKKIETVPEPPPPPVRGPGRPPGRPAQA